MQQWDVIVTRWSDEEQAQVKVIAGTFSKWMNAFLFAKAYKEYYSASAEIMERRCA